jgi:hypothetical protein
MQSVAVALVDRLVEEADVPMHALLHNLCRTLSHIEAQVIDQASSLLDDFDNARPKAVSGAPPRAHRP